MVFILSRATPVITRVLSRRRSSCKSMKAHETGKNTRLQSPKYNIVLVSPTVSTCISGFHDGHKVVKWFWKAVSSFDNEQRLRLLQVNLGSVYLLYYLI